MQLVVKMLIRQPRADVSLLVPNSRATIVINAKRSAIVNWNRLYSESAFIMGNFWHQTHKREGRNDHRVGNLPIMNH